VLPHGNTVEPKSTSGCSAETPVKSQLNVTPGKHYLESALHPSPQGIDEEWQRNSRRPSERLEPVTKLLWSKPVVRELPGSSRVRQDDAWITKQYEDWPEMPECLRREAV
jgi:hypothetical protein